MVEICPWMEKSETLLIGLEIKMYKKKCLGALNTKKPTQLYSNNI